jgi:transitional endoplasmic reticulum ATPase
MTELTSLPVHNPGNDAQITKLWALRILVGGQTHGALITEDGWSDNKLAASIGLSQRLAERGEAYAPGEALNTLLDMHELADTWAASAVMPAVLARNLDRLAAAIGLDALERELLGFAVLMRTDRVLDRVAKLVEPASISHVCEILSAVTKAPMESVQRALAVDGALYDSGLLTTDSSTKGDLLSYFDLLSREFVERITVADHDPIELIPGRIRKAPAGKLQLMDFDFVDDIPTMIDYLRAATCTTFSGMNGLIWGKAGWGKTQLALTAAAAVGAEVYEVMGSLGCGEPIESSQRIRAFQFAQRILPRENTLLVFDDAEDVIATAFAPGWGTDGASRAHLNALVENNRVPTIYVTNSVDGINAGLLQRFDMVIELGSPDLEKRRQLVGKLVPTWVSADTIRVLAGEQSVSPSVLRRVSRIVESVTANATTEDREKRFRGMIQQKIRAQTGRRVGFDRATNADARTYDPAYANADTDLTELVAGIRRAGAGRLLLWGPPGTGKTEFGRWLAQETGRPLQIERASTLLGGVVGETEGKLLQAFETASRAGAVLLIDEADSFLGSRGNAFRSWEVTMVNEMLTQMETFLDGILVLSTNLMDHIDEAALRRVDFKVKFDYLRPAQSAALLRVHCDVLNLPGPDQALLARLGCIGNLTPGDFAVVARQARFRNLATANDFVNQLVRESKLKRSTPGRSMGFLSAVNDV